MRGIMVALAALVVTATVASAQDGLSIDNLSATPRLHEDGGAYDIQVRFMTSAPAVARAEYGADASCPLATEAEGEALRNHRFDIADVPRDEPRFVRVVATAGDQELTSDVIEVAPPAAFPEGSAERIEIPLTVQETAGVVRAETVTFGLPVPEGALGMASAVSLTDGGTALPISARALVRWPDGTIKWLLVTARIAIDAGDTKTLTLALGAEVRPTMREGPDLVREDASTIEVNAVAAGLTIDRTTGEGTITGPDGDLCPLPVSRLTAVDGTVYHGRAERVTVEGRRASTAR